MQIKELAQVSGKLFMRLKELNRTFTRAGFGLLIVAMLLPAFREDTPKIDFLDLSFKKAYRLSKAENKPLFIYISTEHCDICLRTNHSFEDKQVAAFYNAHFVSIRLDPDNMANNLRIGNWGLSQTPSFVFLNRKKDVVYKTSGYESPSGLLGIADSALTATAAGKCKGKTQKKP